jgi:hypothetical protein
VCIEDCVIRGGGGGTHLIPAVDCLPDVALLLRHQCKLVPQVGVLTHNSAARTAQAQAQAWHSHIMSAAGRTHDHIEYSTTGECKQFSADTPSATCRIAVQHRPIFQRIVSTFGSQLTRLITDWGCGAGLAQNSLSIAITRVSSEPIQPHSPSQAPVDCCVCPTCSPFPMCAAMMKKLRACRGWPMTSCSAPRVRYGSRRFGTLRMTSNRI